MPRYNQLASIFKAHGIDDIVCISVNDAFVMNEWKQNQEAERSTFLPGGNGELTDFFGSYSPLPRTDAEKALRSDPRPSIASLYESKAAYLARVGEETKALIDEGFLLPDDRERVMDRAADYWNWIFRD